MVRCMIAMAILLGSAGCVQLGKDFPADTSWLQPGKTSPRDVTLILGPPQAVGRDNATPFWIYHYSVLGLPLKRNGWRELKLFWDGGKRLKRHSYLSSFTPEIRAATRPDQLR